uniref:Uncharacterized protein n=1 Tax=Arundo donax TaxID=35708 RepID=A0A0A9GWR5_ARUDO
MNAVVPAPAPSASPSLPLPPAKGLCLTLSVASPICARMASMVLTSTGCPCGSDR